MSITLSRGKVQSEPKRLTDRKDLVIMLRLTLLAIISWTLPPKFWVRFARFVAKLDIRLRKAEMGRRREELVSKGGKFLDEDVEKLLLDSMSAHCESILQTMRCHLPGDHRPVTTIKGVAHLNEALAQGCGVILWISNFTYSDLVTKIALNHQGYDILQLSNQFHGFSTSKLGIRFINRIQTTIEDRFIAERVVIGDGGMFPVLKHLTSSLKNNAILSIAVGNRAARVVSTPFLTGEIQIATGPAELARMTGAVLLPVFTVKEQPGRYVTYVGEPVNSSDMTRSTYLTNIAENYVRQLTPFMNDYAACWKSWDMMSDTPEPAYEGG